MNSSVVKQIVRKASSVLLSSQNYKGNTRVNRCHIHFLSVRSQRKLLHITSNMSGGMGAAGGRSYNEVMTEENKMDTDAAEILKVKPDKVGGNASNSGNGDIMGEKIRIISEGKVQIPQSVNIFYNPTQEFNRDIRLRS